MEKYFYSKKMKKISKTALALVLAGTFTFSTSSAFASSNTSDNSNFESVELKNKSVINETETNSVDSKGETEVDKPSLVQGDFFYFAKLSIEKVKLILTINNVKEAELFAKFATERLAEAEVLFSKGEQKLAIETIQEALENMDQASEFQKVDFTKKIETTDKQLKTEGKEDIKTESKLPTVEAPTNDLESVKEIEHLLSQNMIALTAAMEKVKNPVAKAALKKNIDKSYIKLEKKLAKMEAKLAKEADKDDELKKEQTNVSKGTTVEVTTEMKQETEVKTETKTSEKLITDKGTESKVEEKTKPAARTKEKKIVEKKTRTEIKQELKEQKTDAKLELKENREEVKKEFKEAKNTLKVKKDKAQKEEKGHK